MSLSVAAQRVVVITPRLSAGSSDRASDLRICSPISRGRRARQTCCSFDFWVELEVCSSMGMAITCNAGPVGCLAQVAVVTGGSRGIGKGIAVALGEAGATVYITGQGAYWRRF